MSDRTEIYICGFEGTINLARWLSWLERRPVTAEVMGSIPIRVVVLLILFGVLAQLGEHLPYKQRVIGSSPIGPTYCYHIDLSQGNRTTCRHGSIGRAADL